LGSQVVKCANQQSGRSKQENAQCNLVDDQKSGPFTALTRRAQESVLFQGRRQINPRCANSGRQTEQDCGEKANR
jgi:hypothetical protein